MVRCPINDILSYQEPSRGGYILGMNCTPVHLLLIIWNSGTKKPLTVLPINMFFIVSPVGFLALGFYFSLYFIIHGLLQAASTLLLMFAVVMFHLRFNFVIWYHSILEMRKLRFEEDHLVTD